MNVAYVLKVSVERKETAKERLDEYSSKTKQFSAMTRDYLKSKLSNNQ